MTTKLIFIFIFIFSAELFSQVIESGFGSSSLLHIRRGGSDQDGDGLADGSFLQVFSKKSVNEDIGRIKEIYSVEFSKDLKDVFKLKTADFNSDGMEDIFCAMRKADNYQRDSDIINIYDGNNGDELYSYSIPDNYRTINDLIVGDFDGDAKAEMVLVLMSDDKKDVVINYIDLEENFSNNGLYTNTASSKFISTSGDLNGDNCDDFVFTQIVTINQSNFQNIVGIDIKNGNILFNKFFENIQGKTITQANLVISNFNNDSLNELAIGTNYSDSSYRIVVLNSNGNDIFSHNSESNEKSGNEFKSFIAVDFNGVGISEIIISENSLIDNIALTNVFKLNVEKGSISLFYSTDSSNSIISFLKAIDINGDCLEELLLVEKSKTSGELEESRLKIVDSKREIKFNYDKSNFNFQLSIYDEIIWTDIGDFNNDEYLDIAITHTWGRDKTNDGKGDNSFTSIFDLKTNSEMFTFHPFDKNSGGYGGYKFAILKNEFTDSEFLRTLNFDSEYSNLNRVNDKFLNKDYSGALLELFEIYKSSKKLKSFTGNEWYPCDYLRFCENIKEFSTVVTMERECFGTIDSGVLNHPTAAGRRLGRIVDTFWYRINNNTLTFKEFVISLKSIYSHLVWSSSENNFTAGTNHGAIFELNSYIPSLFTLNICKDLDNAKIKNWLNYLDERIESQLKHVLSDGVHDEHSYYYSYRVLQVFNNFQGLFNENYNQINQNFTHLNELIKTVENMLNYSMFSVKPINAVPDKKLIFIESDVPAIGDSRGIFEGMFGKYINDSTYGSFLDAPLHTDYIKYWIDKNLERKLEFVANSLFRKKNDFDMPVTKYFDASGIFISRSNWLQDDNKTYDNKARFAYYKGGEIVPKPGVYDGYSTTSKHAHADLLSVELSAYNHNLVIELGGYVNPSSSKIINNFNKRRYNDLYGYESYFDDFLTARHYFKGTAAHNTCYINNTDQIEFVDHYKWSGLSGIRKQTAYFSISNQLDFYSAAYAKNFKEFYIHRREMFYIKPKNEEKIFSDYWVFSDEIHLDNIGNNIDEKIEQIWHLAPSQNSIQFSSDSLKLTTNNMIILSDKANNYSAELIDSYNQTDEILVDSKTLKFVLENLKQTNELFTIVFPFEDKNKYSNFSLSSKILYDNHEMDVNNATSYEFTFSKKDGANNIDFKDYIFISKNKFKTFNWVLFDGREVKTENNKFIFERYMNGEKIKTLKLNWDDIKKNEEQTEKDCNLEQNYPNPFNHFTTIQFRLKSNCKVNLSIYNILGQKIKTLVDQHKTAGLMEINWDGIMENGSKAVSGIYFYQLIIEGSKETKKMVLLR